MLKWIFFGEINKLFLIHNFVKSNQMFKHIYERNKISFFIIQAVKERSVHCYEIWGGKLITVLSNFYLFTK